MGWRIVQQPCGCYARFSEIVDDFTDYNMTREEAVLLCIQEYGMGEHEAKEKVARGVDDHGHRWKEAISIISAVHGEKVAQERIQELSQQEERHDE